MAQDAAFEEINAAKANLSHIYNQPDPRAYFRELRKLGYAIPGAAKPIFLKLIARLRRRRDQPVTVLDIGCSYGVNAAILKHDLSMPDLYDHWGQRSLDNASSEEVMEHDEQYFAKLEEAEDIEVIGLDQAGNAVQFAEEVGLLDDGLAIDLERQALPATARERLSEVDLMVSTGCVGYVTERSFDRLLPEDPSDSQPWIANFVLRMFPFEPIQQTLSERGYQTEKLRGQTFIQRSFVSAEEQKHVVDQLLAEGIDPSGKEAEGHLHAEFFLSRPRKDAAETPIESLLTA